jgi:uncharacterized iron-regulated membrane protein
VTEQLELVLLVAFVVGLTGLVITGVVRLAVGWAVSRSETGPDGSVRAAGAKAQANGTATPSGSRCRAAHDQETSTHADEASSVERRKWRA